MSIFEVRQAIESAIPWWVPLLPIVIVLVLIVVEVVKEKIRKSKLSKIFREKLKRRED